MSIVEYLQENWKSITCQTLNAAGEAGVYASIASRFTKNKWVNIFAVASSGLGVAATIAGCGIPEENLPVNPWWDEDDRCTGVVGSGQLFVEENSENGVSKHERSNPNAAVRIISVTEPDFGKTRCTYENVNGEVVVSNWESSDRYGSTFTWFIHPGRNSYCDGYEPVFPDYDGQPIGPPIAVPKQEDEECTWTILPMNSYIDRRGVYHTLYKVTPTPYDCGKEFYYWDTDGGPAIGPPYDPLIEPPNVSDGADIPDLPAATYVLYGNCEKAEDWGEDPEDFEQPEIEYEIAAQGGIEGLAARLDAIALMVSWNNWLRTPTCNCSKPQLEGRWVTAQWISDHESVDSDMRLRKRTRWRTKSSRTDFQLAEFFDQFWWDAGPICVGHKGGWWGTPQVWAKSYEEGQRVIREIGREAGLDPDLVGEWWSSASSNPRYGRGGRMRLRQIEGIHWISSRDGPDMLPMG